MYYVKSKRQYLENTCTPNFKTSNLRKTFNAISCICDCYTNPSKELYIYISVSDSSKWNFGPWAQKEQ